MAIRPEEPAKTSPGSLRLIFFTDTHLEPELSGVQGCAQAFAKIKSLKPDLCIQGGDHCFDLNAPPKTRSTMLLDLYTKTEHVIDAPIQHVIGNHDVFGLAPSSGVSVDDPMYGKQAFEQRFAAKTYRSFDRNGYHFLLLDSIGITPDRQFDARIDPEQIAWIKSDLAATPSATPVIVVTHCPLVSAAPQYAPPFPSHTPNLSTYLVGNAFEVLPLFEGHNVIAVLQGHTHLNETVYWRNVPYITSGAVCGNWWRGPLLGTPEGFTVLELAGGKVDWHYETYGWSSVAPAPSLLRPLASPRHG
jgi:Icc protein